MEKNKIEQYKVKLINEAYEFQSKIEQLDEYIHGNSSNFIMLDKIQQRLLTKQLESMIVYKDILIERMNLLGIKI